jgi:stage III sporulation protein AG
MGDGFKKFDKKTIVNIAGALVLGVILLVLSSNLFRQDDNVMDSFNEEAIVYVSAPIDQDNSFEALLERRLAETLSRIDGAGEVEVMLTLSHGREIVVAEDMITNESITRDLDAVGDGVITETSSIDARKIIISSDGVSKPLILQEVQPRIEGAIIIAEGGDDIIVRQALTSAAGAVLGLQASRVQVFRMRD